MATKRRAETAQENREKLIHAARKAFAEKGFAAASMDELTASRAVRCIIISGIRKGYWRRWSRR